LDAKCEHVCRGCYLTTQRYLPARSSDVAIEHVSVLMSQDFDTRITGSNLVRYPSIEKLISHCEQDYLLGDASSINEDVGKMKLIKECGVQRIFLTSPLSYHLPENRAIDIEKSVKAVKQSEIEPVLTYVLGRGSEIYLTEMVDECLRLGVTSMRFMRYIPTLDEELNSFITDDELPAILGRIDSLRKNIPKSQLNIHIHGNFGTWFRKDKGPACFSGENLFIIGLDNKVYPCEFLMYPQYVLGEWDENNLHIYRNLRGLSNYDCKYKQIFVDKKEFSLEHVD